MDSTSSHKVKRIRNVKMKNLFRVYKKKRAFPGGKNEGGEGMKNKTHL